MYFIVTPSRNTPSERTSVNELLSSAFYTDSKNGRNHGERICHNTMGAPFRRSEKQKTRENLAPRSFNHPRKEISFEDDNSLNLKSHYFSLMI